MTLITCKECKHQISSTAAACPHCGAKRKPQTSAVTWLVAIVFGVPCLGSIVIAPVLQQRAARAERAAYERMTPEQKAAFDARKKSEQAEADLKSAAYAAIELAKIKVRAALKDPDSAKFGSVSAKQTPAGGIIVCGSVNSRNSFGGYTGDSSFIWSQSLLVFEESTPNFAKTWNASCVKWKTLASR